MECFDPNEESDTERYIIESGNESLEIFDDMMNNMIALNRRKMENNKRGSSKKDDIVTRSRKRSVKSIPILYKNVDGTEKEWNQKQHSGI